MTDHTSPPRVLELGATAAPAFAARLYVHLGADVIKVELHPDGDPARHRGPYYEAAGAAEPAGVAFHYLHQGKRSVALDLDEPDDLALLDDLLDWCDAVLVDRVFAARPEVAERVARAQDTARTFVTPFGTSGPDADRESLPGTVFALGGELSMLPGGLGHKLYPDAPPLLTRGNVAEFDGGVIGALVSLASLYHEESREQVNDVSAVEACVSLNRWLVSHFDESGWIETRATRSYPYAGMFECADGYLMLQPSTEAHWKGLVELMGSPAWALKPEYASRAQRNAAGASISSEIRKWAKTLTKQEILYGGLRHGFPAAPFRDAEEVTRCPQFGSRGFFVGYGEDAAQDGPTVPGLPFALKPFGQPSGRRAPDFGEHTEEVRAAVGRAGAAAGAPVHGAGAA